VKNYTETWEKSLYRKKYEANYLSKYIRENTLIKIGGIFENKDLTLYQFTSFDNKPGIEGEILSFFAMS